MVEKTIRANADANSEKTIRSKPERNSEKTIRAQPNAGNEKTIRAQPNQNEDKTIRAKPQGGADKTIRASADAAGSDKTVRATPDDTSDKTVRADQPMDFDQPKESDQGSRQSTSTHVESKLSFDEIAVRIEEEERGILTLNGKKFTKVGVIAQNTGEGNIFKLKDDKGELYAVKIYKEVGFKPEDGVIKNLKGLRHDDLLYIHDFGYYVNPVENVELFFELMEYVQGGAVSDAIPIQDAKRLTEIIREATNALHYLHSQKIVHGDIKTGNLLFRDAAKTDIVIADFGVSTLMDNASSQLINRQGSITYMPPEIVNAAASINSDGELVFSQKARTSPYTDWYSLGITILKIWLGDQLFENMDGLSEVKQEEELTNPKILENDNVDPNILHLVKGLTLVARKDRWGYPEVSRWLKGEKVPIRAGEKIERTWEPFEFDLDAKLTANSAHELGELLFKYPDLGSKYLYKGLISDHFKANKDNRRMLEMEEIVEKIYPRDSKAGVLMAAYMLNPSLPYIGLDGKSYKIQEKSELAQLLDTYSGKYSERLKSPGDPFFVFLTGKRYNYTPLYQKWMKEMDGSRALYQIIYHLDAELPFRFCYEEKGKSSVAKANSVKELCSLMRKHDKESQSYLFDGKIVAWLNSRGETALVNTAEDMIKRFKEKAPSKAIYGMLFAMDKDLGVSVKHGDVSTTFKTRDDIAHYLMKYGGENKLAFSNTDSAYYIFMNARGWKGWSDYIQSLYVKKNHKYKTGAYDNNMAAIIAAKSLNSEVPFTFDDGTVINSPEELVARQSKVKKQLAEEVKDPTGRLMSWLATFYHENPFDETKKPYEELLLEYTEFLSSLNVKGEIINRFDAAVRKKRVVAKRAKRKDRRYLNFRRVITVIFALFTAYLGYMIFTEGFPFSSDNPLSSNPFSASSNYYGIWVVIGIVGAFFSSDSGGCFGILFGGALMGALGGLVVYFLAFLVLKFVMPALPFIAIGVVGLVLFFVLRKMWHNSYTNRDLRKSIYGSLAGNHGNTDALEYAYGSKEEFSTSMMDELSTYSSERRRSWRALLMGTAMGLLTLGSASFAYSGMAENIPSFTLAKEKLTELTSFNTTNAEFLKGTWEGTLEGRKLVMEITSVDGNSVVGNVVVYYDNEVHQNFVGKYNSGKERLGLSDVLDSKFKGDYFLTVSDEGNTLTGEYVLSSNGSKFPVKLSKK